VIAAAQSSFRELLRRQLASEPRVEIVGDASDSPTAYLLTRRLRPDILVIECALNREFCAYHFRDRSAGAESTTGVIAIFETPRIHEIVEAFELGTRGVVMRASLPFAWKTAILSIVTGQYWVDDRTIQFLVETIRGFLLRTNGKARSDLRLTARETQIASRIAAGRSNKEVGQEFDICERTVKHHLTNIFRKAGVSTRLELALLLRETIDSRSHVPDGTRIREQRDADETGKRRLFAVPDR
jgi:DNA-binding NarL/FixJ family response regulator